MRRSVCPFVCLRMIRTVRFQVCVFSSAQERSSEQLTLFPVAMVKAHLLTAHLPACFIRNFMHAFGQLGDNASQFPAASKKTSHQPANWQAGTIASVIPNDYFVFYESLLKTFLSLLCHCEVSASC